ncbi:hypothetical protein LINPERHAP1_LOCUS17773, partial [Linum perenne]
VKTPRIKDKRWEKSDINYFIKNPEEEWESFRIPKGDLS